jgi:hypothetical protein
VIGTSVAVAAPLLTALVVNHFFPLYDPNEDTSGRDNGLNPYGDLPPTPDEANSDEFRATHPWLFAAGTHGEYIDFGAGEPAILHGKERVMTEAEGRAEARATGDSSRLLEGMNDLLGQLRRMERWMPLAMRDAVLTAGVR